MGTLADLIEANAPGVQVQRLMNPGKEKGEIITAIVIGISTGLAASVLYDLIKLAIKRVGGSIGGHDKVEIGGRTLTVTEINITTIKQYTNHDQEN